MPWQDGGGFGNGGGMPQGGPGGWMTPGQGMGGYGYGPRRGGGWMTAAQGMGGGYGDGLPQDMNSMPPSRQGGLVPQRGGWVTPSQGMGEWGRSDGQSMGDPTMSTGGAAAPAASPMGRILPSPGAITGDPLSSFDSTGGMMAPPPMLGPNGAPQQDFLSVSGMPTGAPGMARGIPGRIGYGTPMPVLYGGWDKAY